MDENQTTQNPTDTSLPLTSYIKDKNGVLTEIADVKAREAIEALSKESHNVGCIYITESEEDNPALNFGGTWELKDTHMFQGWYVYARIA